LRGRSDPTTRGGCPKDRTERNPNTPSAFSERELSVMCDAVVRAKRVAQTAETAKESAEAKMAIMKQRLFVVEKRLREAEKLCGTGKPDEMLLGYLSAWFSCLMATLIFGGEKIHMVVLTLGLLSIFSITILGFPFRITRATRKKRDHRSSDTTAVVSPDKALTHKKDGIKGNGGMAMDRTMMHENGHLHRHASHLESKNNNNLTEGKEEEKDSDLKAAEGILEELLDEIGAFYPDTEIEIFMPLSDLGIDSLTSDALSRRISERFQMPVLPTELPLLPSIVHLANKIAMRKLSLATPPLPLLPQVRPGFSMEGLARRRWSPLPPQRFEVRVGPNYQRNKTKRAAVSTFYEPIAIDLLTSSSRIDHVTRFIDFSGVEDAVGSGERWMEGLPPYFVVNFQLPLYQPSFFGDTNGPGLSLVFYFRLTKAGLESARAKNNPARLLQKFCKYAGTADESKASGIDRRWKNIVHIANKDDLKLSFVSKEIVRKFSGKPFLTRSRKEVFRGKNYLELDINQHTSNYVKKKAVFNLKQYLASMILDIGFLVEAQEEDEMPENLIGAVRLEGVNYERDAVEVEWNRVTTTTTDESSES